MSNDGNLTHFLLGFDQIVTTNVIILHSLLWNTNHIHTL